MANQKKKPSEKKKRQSARVPKLKSLGKYQIEKEIGAGGMGAVFLAKDTTLNRLAALKVLPRDKAENPVLVKRFKAEGQAAAHLRHENIVSVYDAGEEDGYLYIALEYVEGTDLHNLISKRSRIPVRRSLEIITQVTEALAHAYQQGIVHRDIKPANILIRQDGVVKLTDLGLARSIDDNTETSITRAGTTVGTVDYMAPEQARDSKAADIRSDIYSLGCTWYHMLTGRAPFSEGSLTNKLAAHATTPPPDPRQLNERVPEGIVAIIHRMMAKAQSARYQNPQELLDDLKNSNLKRSNVDNNVLEGLASESDGEFSAIESNTTVAADSSDFQINQFIPDFGQAEDEEEDQEVSSRLSTSFDLQDLAGEVEIETGTTAPGLERVQKPIESKPSKPKSNQKESAKKSSQQKRRSASEPEEEGSVISDSAVKAREKTRGSKPGSAVDQPQHKRVKNSGSDAKSSRPESKNRNRPVRKVPTLPEPDSTDDEGGISIDYRKISMLAGGVLLLAILLWWGFKTLTAPGPIQDGPGSNPFATGEQQPQEGQQNAPQPRQAEAGNKSENKPEKENADAAVEVVKTGRPDPKRPWQKTSVRGKENNYLPKWGSSFPDLNGAGAEKLAASLPLLKVAAGKEGAGIYGSLDEAVNDVSSKGAMIRLYGQGPFLLTEHRLSKVPQLILMADSDQRPVVLLQAKQPAETQSERDLISLSEGALRLQGIHFLCDHAAIPGTGDCNIFGIRKSDLTLQDCSFTLTGSGSKTVRLIKSTEGPRTTASRPEGESRILLENSVITGSQLQPIFVDQPYADVLISNCYISTRGEPCLEMSSPKEASRVGSLLQKRTFPRTARLFSSTLLSDQSILELNGEKETQDKEEADSSGAAAHRTEVFVINSVLIGDPSETSSTAIALNDWPQDKLRSNSKSRFDDLQLKLENSLLWGWPTYLRSTEPGDSKKVFQIDSHRTWQQSWGESLAGDIFNSEVPENFQELRSPAFVKPLLNFSKQAAVHAVSEGGLIAGCNPAALPALSQGQRNRFQATINRPQVASLIGDAFSKAKTVTFDMTKGNLSDFLNSSAVSGPTKVLVRGQGVCYTSPIRLENKQVQLQFQATSGAPMIVELRLLPSAAQSRSRKENGIESFISVKNSTLDLTGGAFRISLDRKRLVPRHFLDCQSSRVMLDQTLLHAMLVNDRQFESVVHVAPEAKGTPSQVAIRDSFLVSSGTILNASTPRLNLEVDNSLLISLQDLFDLQAQSGDAPELRVSLKQSTLAPAGTIFAFHRPEGTAAGKVPAQIFADETLFFPAPAASAVRSQSDRPVTLFSFPKGFQDDKRVQWWGNANGFMVERLRLQEGVESSPGDAEFQKFMAQQFGEEADHRPLAIRGGVMFKQQKLPPLVKIEPKHFELLTTCKAAGWSDLKQPLGADLGVLQALLEGGSQSGGPGKRRKSNLAF